MDSDLSGAAMAALQNKPVALPGAPKNIAAIGKAAKEFESVFVSQFLGSMFSGISTDGPFGGGQGEEMFRSLMVDQYAGAMEKQGGFGLAASVQREMLKMQGAS